MIYLILLLQYSLIIFLLFFTIFGVLTRKPPPFHPLDVEGIRRLSEEMTRTGRWSVDSVLSRGDWFHYPGIVLRGTDNVFVYIEPITEYGAEMGFGSSHSGINSFLSSAKCIKPHTEVKVKIIFKNIITINISTLKILVVHGLGATPSPTNDVEVESDQGSVFVGFGRRVRASDVQRVVTALRGSDASRRIADFLRRTEPYRAMISSYDPDRARPEGLACTVTLTNQTTVAWVEDAVAMLREIAAIVADP
jgi:hypothetical protein